jgi:anti-sigma regulatory factor (Ser/Thr protein kinase)
MRKMPVISSDAALNDRVTQICERFQNVFQPVFFDDSEEALEFLRYELPEISVMNFSDRQIDTRAILGTIKSDPWLHYGGIVAVHKQSEEQEISKEVPNSNIISMLPRGRFVSSFFRVLKIVIENRHILFQREIQSYLTGTISGNFVMDNDPFNVRTYSNLVTNFLYNSNYIDADRKERLHVALFEMLMNAVEHGNCDISYDEKTNWLENGGNMIDLIRQKTKNPEVKNKRVYFSYRITVDRSYYTIRDEGGGFDWRSHMAPDPDEVNLGMHGHGIRMTGHYVENLQYNDAGNEVSFEMPHQEREAHTVPGIFQNQEETVFHDGDTVFTEGEESNYLYYIVSGQLDVYSSSELVSTLGPEDIFLGEMSFLLNDRRSATVIANGTVTLLRISKNSFVNAIKANPHYGIFLARLLAQRISKLNVRLANAAQKEAVSV